MSDLFTLKNVVITKELGAVLKGFRTQNKITAKSLINQFDSANSYISKLENGDFKKIDSKRFTEICCFITGDKYGIENYLGHLSQNINDYSLDTQLSIYNIDELLVEHKVDSALISFVTEYLDEHNISIQELASQINANEEIKNRPEYDDMPTNIWISFGDSFQDAIIKLSIPTSYIEEFVSGKITTIHRSIALAIIYGMFSLGKEEKPLLKAYETLPIYHLSPKRMISINEKNVDSLFGGMDTDTASDLKEFTEELKVIATITKQTGKKRIHQIASNMHNDPAFFFAYISKDLSPLNEKSRETKQKFLHELNDLVSKYSEIDESAESYD